MTTQQRLADIFVELTGVDHAAPGKATELLSVLAVRSRELLGTRACAVLSMPTSTEPVRAFGSDAASRDLVLLAHTMDEGPCPDCYRAGAPVPRTDLTSAVTRQRWPNYAPRALALGFTQVAARPLQGRESVVGALVVYGTEDAPITDEGLVLAQSLADVVAVVLLRDRELRQSLLLTDQLTHALSSRLAIEQAKGVIATRKSLTMDEAFALLRGHARSHQRKIAEAARDVVEGRLEL
ncbi:ANTAR domain-containing protein [Streptomyces sp. NPDC059063]|uniref:ANTAR domain-containing protein n=1 Tax=unclassified Streptomyces TaxID=2593676 RepID=UPI00367625FB